MSSMFRPVVETWGESSDCFIEHDALVAVLEEIADSSGYDTKEYGDMTVVWVGNGKSFLAEIQKNLTAENLRERLPYAEFCRDNNLASLVDNMRAFAPIWAKSIDPADGSLQFYIDNC